MTVLTSYMSFKFPRLRGTLEGEPIVLVEHGRIIERNLRRERMTHDELAAEARLAQIADLDDVRLAVLETNGTDQLHHRGAQGGRRRAPRADVAPRWLTSPR